jgi:orotate phosphoribosyltransferase
LSGSIFGAGSPGQVTISGRKTSETSWIFIPVRIVAMTTATADVERVFRDSGALREGHFVLASGRHSALYLEKFQVLQHPRETERLCSAIAMWAKSLGVDTVAGPTTGGIILAHEVARQLGVRAIFAERRDATSGREFRRGFALAPGERVLVVDDIMTTGGSVHETIDAVRAAGGTVAAAAVLVDRSGGAARLDVPLHALWRLDIPSYAAAECPLCANGVPAMHPGTTPAPVGIPR